MGKTVSDSSESESDNSLSSNENQNTNQNPLEMSKSIVKAANRKLGKIDKDTLKSEDLSDIIVLFQNALDLDPKNIDALLGQAYVHGIREEFDKVTSVLEKAKEVSPSDARVEIMQKELKRMTGQEVPDDEDDEDDEDEDDQDSEDDSDVSSDEEEETEEINENKEEETEEKSEPGPSDIPQLVHNGTMTKVFYDALRLVFGYFDKNRDNSFDDTELNSFYQAVNGHPIDKKTVQFLKQNFHTNRRGHLTLEGFLTFYLSQTAGKQTRVQKHKINEFTGDPEETWNDLTKLGFDKQCKPIDGRYSNVKIK